MNNTILKHQKTIAKFKAEIEKVNCLIKRIQEKCQHNDTDVKYSANTGNYDPTEDVYLEHYTCKQCDMKWTITKRPYYD